MSRLTLGVLFGGASSEHEVSLLSATSVLRQIPQDTYDVVMIGITKNGRWLLYCGGVDDVATGEWEQHACKQALLSPDRSTHGLMVLEDDGSWKSMRLDAVFPVLHGKHGEDGTVQGLLALAGIPCVGCGVLASAACMDKAVTRTLLEQAGIAGVKWEQVLYTQRDDFDALETRVREKLGYPVFVKPANAGSSVGISKAHDSASLKEAIHLAFDHDRKVIIEEAVVGREVECAVLGNDEPFASILGEIAPKAEFYDYNAKYVDDSTDLYIPARLSPQKAEEVRAIAKKAYTALGCTGLARVDFFVRESDGSVLLNEPNTLPGFTSISMYPKLMEASGIPYGELIRRLVTLAIEREESHE